MREKTDLGTDCKSFLAGTLQKVEMFLAHFLSSLALLLASCYDFNLSFIAIIRSFAKIVCSSVSMYLFGRVLRGSGLGGLKVWHGLSERSPYFHAA